MEILWTGSDHIPRCPRGDNLRFTSLYKSRVETDFTDMISVENPAEESLQAETVTTMGARTVLPL